MASNSLQPKTRLFRRTLQQTPVNFVDEPIILGHWLPRSIWLIATLGLCRVFYQTWRFALKPITCESETLPFSGYANDRPAKWKAVVGKLKREWKQIYLGCALTLSLSVALLQIDLVLQNSIGRTTAITAFILSGAGLMLSATFRLVIYQSKNGGYPNQWIEASERFDSLRSIEFWSLLSLPLVLLVWSVIFCSITVLTLPWSVQHGGVLPDRDNSVTNIGNIFSVTFLMFLTLMVIGPVYRAIKFARELS